MKSFRFLTLLLLWAVASCTNGPKTYTYDSQNPFIDLGTIKEIDGIVAFDVLVKNETNDTIMPLRAATICSCTTVDVYFEPMAPGQTITMHCTYDPSYRKGPQEEAAALYFDGAAPAHFGIKADVVPFNHDIKEDHPYDLGLDLHTSHRLLPFGRVAPGESKEMFFRFGNGSTKKANIQFIPDEEGAGTVKFRQPGKVAADWRDTIHVKFTMPADKVPGDTVRFNIHPTVNGQETETKMEVYAICR